MEGKTHGSSYKMLKGRLHPTHGAVAEWYGRCGIADGTGKGEDEAGCGHAAAPCIPLTLVPTREAAAKGVSRRRTQPIFHLSSSSVPFPWQGPPRPFLTVRVLQLGHGGHEGLLGHVAGRLLHQRLLVRAVQLLRELDGLQSCQAAGDAVDDGNALRLRGVETWERAEQGCYSDRAGCPPSHCRAMRSVEMSTYSVRWP